MLDNMSISKHIDYDPKESKFKGYIDIGSSVSEENSGPATEALVLMVVAVNGHWKLPIAYFFVAGLSGKERANLVYTSLQMIHQTGALAVSLTCDGPSCHLAMLRALGASLDTNPMSTFFVHPSDASLKVHVFLDIVHYPTLVQNC